MSRFLQLLLGCLLGSSLVAGCTDSGAGPDDPVLGQDGRPIIDGDGLQVWNYTTIHEGGAPFVKTYEGRLTPDEATQGGVPLGASLYGTPLETCCSVDFIEVTDLLVVDQLLALRVNVTWTNTEADHAGFDAAICVPWNCLGFNYGPDESQQPGEHTDSFTAITAGQEGMPNALLGVRYTNAALSSGLTYMVQVEAVPIANALRFADPYLIDIADNATLGIELVGVFADEVSGGLMFYDEEDRPFHYHPFNGRPGSRQNLTIPGGEYVVFPFDLVGGFPRLSTDVEPARLELELLEEEFGILEIASVPDAQLHTGTYDFHAEPASMDSFPWFMYADGAAVQDLMGIGQQVGGARIGLSSSSGVIAEVFLSRLAVQTNGDAVCLQCGANVPSFDPANYIDDDGIYQVEWSSQGSAGQFVIFTAKYVR